jgi:hypothetical protein
MKTRHSYFHLTDKGTETERGSDAKVLQLPGSRGRAQLHVTSSFCCTGGQMREVKHMCLGEDLLLLRDFMNVQPAQLVSGPPSSL